jgi:hypothetical protein
LLLTFACPPNICNAVSIIPVNDNTHMMKLPRIIIPGRRNRCAARNRIVMMKATPRDPTVTIYGKSLTFEYGVSRSQHMHAYTHTYKLQIIQQKFGPI